jgi:Tol biopolymer transport system component
MRPLGLTSDLVFGTEWDNSGPAWSLAGDRIAYNVVEPASGAVSGTFRIHLVDADGRNDIALPGPALESVQEAWPAWSPDGHSILVHRWTWQPGGEGWLAVMPADGSVAAHDIGRRYPGGQDTGLVKGWSPDGTRILVRVDTTQEIYSIDPVSGEQTQLPWTGADLPDYRRLAP